MTTSNASDKPAQPLAVAPTAELGLVERLWQRTLPKHGGREADYWAHHWNLTIGDSKLHAEAAAEIERLQADQRRIEFLQQWVDSSAARGFQWDTFTFICAYERKPVRQQLDEQIAAGLRELPKY